MRPKKCLFFRIDAKVKKHFCLVPGTRQLFTLKAKRFFVFGNFGEKKCFWFFFSRVSNFNKKSKTLKKNKKIKSYFRTDKKGYLKRDINIKEW